MRPPKILLVDDDADQRRAVAAVLKGIGEIVEAADGEDALARIATDRPRLILLDVSMPGMGGLEALRRIRKLSPSSTVIMLTSESAIESAREALVAGASAYVTKPFDIGFLRAEVSRLLEAPRLPTSGAPWRIAP
ncbi:MAG: response regulator [Elusimicrobiota bacterium]